MEINKLTQEDKEYLEKFSTLEALHMNSTKLSCLANMPDNEEMLRLELSDNGIEGSELVNLKKYEQLTTLKLAKNKIKTYDDIECLKELKSLKNLDLEQNPVSKLSDYKTHLFTMLPSLQVLDSHNRRGELVFSQDGDSSD